jgi:hypothetical protein
MTRCVFDHRKCTVSRQVVPASLHIYMDRRYLLRAPCRTFLQQVVCWSVSTATRKPALSFFNETWLKNSIITPFLIAVVVIAAMEENVIRLCPSSIGATPLWKKQLDLFWQNLKIIRKKGKFNFKRSRIRQPSVFFLHRPSVRHSIHEKGNYHYSLAKPRR